MDSQQNKVKQPKYTYLEQSFQKQLQRSYERGNNRHQNCYILSPNNLRSPERRYERSSSLKKRSIHRESEFSPYEDREDNIREKLLMNQLRNHNRILSEQIAEYQITVSRLHGDLRVRTEELNEVSIMRQKEKTLFEEMMAEMKNEIKILLTKNTYLEQRSAVLEKEAKTFQDQMMRAQSRNRSMSVTLNSSKNQSSKIVSQIEAILKNTANPLNETTKCFNSKKNNRETGKLVNQSFSGTNSCVPSPKNATLPKSSSSEEAILFEIQSLMKKVHKYQEFTQSIVEMHNKITGKSFKNEHGELKGLWKWLKDLGHSYNITQKWKKMLMGLIGIGEEENPDSFSVDEILQKTVIELHKR